MKTPTHLKHKPIITVDNYDNASDAKALSIGEAQWENNTNDISAKIFRHNDDSDRWSPQSEELPLGRVIDLCILSITSFLIDEKQTTSISNLNETIVDYSQIKKIQKYYQENEIELRDKIIELRRIIDLYFKN